MYRKLIRLWFIVCLTIITGISFAVTEDEIGKITDAMPDKPVMQPEQERNLLVFDLCKGFKHSSIPYWDKALGIMAEKTGAFKVEYSHDMSIFNADSLRKFDAICFNNTTHLEPDEAQQKAIMDFIASGKGIVGIHAATDSFYNWPEGMMMMGGVFKGHPWTAGGTWAIKIDDPDHPLMKPFKGQGFKINDEIYRTVLPQYSRDKQRVLMSLDMSDPTTRNVEGVQPDDMDTGISWVKSVGKGRLFYCSLGHNHHLTWTRPILEHYLAGIQYALGDYKIDDAPLGMKMDSAKLNSLMDEVKLYDWQKSRAGIYELQRFIQAHYYSTKALAAIEAKLLETLDSDISFAAKDCICRELADIGTEQSVPLLSKMLTDEETSNIARCALENIPGKAVDNSLMAGLEATKEPEIQIGIITSLGIRKCEDAVDVLSTYSKSSDDAVAAAAIQALGYIGTKKAADELNALMATGKSSLKQRVQDALLNTAKMLNQSGDSGAAQGIFNNLYAKDNPSLIQAAALNGLVISGSPDAKKLLSGAIMGDDVVIQQTALKILADIKDKQLLESIASGISGLSEPAQVQLLTALAQNPQKVGMGQALQLIKSNNQSVRTAAYLALAELGDVSAVQPLAEAAARAQDRSECDAAQAALYRISAEGTNAFILKEIQQAAKADSDDPVAVEYVQAAAERRIPEADKVLTAAALSDNRKLASASIKAIQTLAEPEQMPDLVDLLIAKPGSATETLVVVVGLKISETDKRAELLLTKYPEVQDKKTKISLLHVMGKLGDPQSVPLLKEAYESDDADIHQAAFRAMTNWLGSDFLDRMKDIAEKDPDMKTKILAFRAYVRMLKESGRKDNDIVNALITSWQMVQRPEEKRLIVAALADYGDPRALEFVQKALEDPEYKAEAEVSLVAICERLAKQHASLIKPILSELLNSSNETVKSKAREILFTLDE